MVADGVKMIPMSSNGVPQHDPPDADPAPPSANPAEPLLRARQLVLADHRLIMNFLFQLLALGYGAAFGYSARFIEPGISILGHGVPIVLHLYVVSISVEGFAKRCRVDRLILIGQMLISLIVMGLTILWVAGALYYHDYRGDAIGW